MLSLFLSCFLFRGISHYNAAQFTVKDYDGNIYATVKIGSQIWMSENLKTTHYQNGDAIPFVKPPLSWGKLTTGSYSDYNNDTTLVHEYGRLYNWYAVNDPRKICPPGWHIATDADWTKLSDFLGGASAAGAKLRETDTLHWYKPNAGATNSSKFSARGGGVREMYGGYMYLKLNGIFWCADAYSTTEAWKRDLAFNEAAITRFYTSKNSGLSVRCVKD
jgi:uncharacterized protein (TIGR02145 family)